MKKILITLLSVATLLTAQKARAEVSLSYFYDSLEDEGDWFEADDYGYCWQPRNVGADWSPYTDGYWTYTDAGWTWVSYESFGWATYHYGRWADISGRGWVWVPGYEWGPAWVSWRSNDDYVGWAPLPARAALTVGVSIGSDVDYDYDIGPSYYNFTSCNRFGSPSLRQVIVDRSENITIINQTTNITNISYRDNYVYNGGPDYDRINRRSERPIERLRLDRITNVEDRRDNRFNRRENGRLTVVAPPVVPVGERQRPRNIKANLGKVQTDRGWANVRDARLAERTRQKIREENKGRSRPPINRNNESVAQALRSEARQKQVAVAPVRPAMGRQKRLANQAQNAQPAADRPAANKPPQSGNASNPRQQERRNDAAQTAAVAAADQERNARQQARQNAARNNPAAPVDRDKPRNQTATGNEVARQRQAAQNRQEAAATDRKNADRKQQQAALERQQADNKRQQANQLREQANNQRQSADQRANQREQQVNRQREQAVVARQQEAVAARQQAARRESQQNQAAMNQARAQRQAVQQQQQRRQQIQAQPNRQPAPQQRQQARPQQIRPQAQTQRPPAQPVKGKSNPKAKPNPEDDGR